MAVLRGAHTSRSAESTTTIVGYSTVHALENTFGNYFYALALYSPQSRKDRTAIGEGGFFDMDALDFGGLGDLAGGLGDFAESVGDFVGGIDFDF